MLDNFCYCRRSLKGARTSLELSQAQRLACLGAGPISKVLQLQTVACGWSGTCSNDNRHMWQGQQLNYKNYLLLSSCQMEVSNDLKLVVQPDVRAKARTHVSQRILSSGPLAGWPEDMFSKTEIRWQAQTVTETRAVSGFRAAPRRRQQLCTVVESLQLQPKIYLFKMNNCLYRKNIDNPALSWVKFFLPPIFR